MPMPARTNIDEPAAAELDAVRRLRAELVGQAASALRFLAEMNMAAERRAADLLALLGELGGRRGPAGEFLAVLTRDLAGLSESARTALSHVEGVRLAELADRLEAVPMRCGARCSEEPSWVCSRARGHAGRHESAAGGDWHDER